MSPLNHETQLSEKKTKGTQYGESPSKPENLQFVFPQCVLMVY